MDALFVQQDLLDIICDHLDRAELAQLLTVSSHFFACGAPRIWSRVPHVDHLTDLVVFSRPQAVTQEDTASLENSDANTEASDASTEGTEASADSTDLSTDSLSNQEADMSRFNIYAPWVKTLDVNFTVEQTPSSGWIVACFLTTKQSPLLPNLRELTINRELSSRFATLMRFSVEALLGPCLAKLELLMPSDSSLWFEPSVASGILERVLDYTRNLEALHLLVQTPDNLHHPPTSVLADITQFRSLRSLTCSNYMVDSIVLCLLGTCPMLEYLTITAPTVDLSLAEEEELSDFELTNSMSVANLTLPVDSFPRLRHLGLRLLLCSVVTRLWDCPALVQDLVSADLLFLPELDPSVISDVVGCICAASPHIQELSLDQYSDDNGALPEILHHVKQLPIHRLQMKEMGIFFLQNEFGLLVSGLSGLQLLDIPWTTLLFQELTLVARYLPRLRRLNMYLDMENWPEELDLGSITPSPSSLLLASPFLFGDEFGVNRYSEYQTLGQYTGVLARNLHTLWPKGVKCVQEDTSGRPRRPSDERYLALLNRKIEAMHESASFDVLTVKDCDASWLYPRS